MAKVLSKFGEQQLVMVNYACGFNQSETEKYFEWIILSLYINIELYINTELKRQAASSKDVLIHL